MVYKFGRQFISRNGRGTGISSDAALRWGTSGLRFVYPELYAIALRGRIR